MKNESHSSNHPENAVAPRPIMECWSDDQIIEMLRSGELSIKPLPGLENRGIGWVNCPVTVGEYLAQETYRTKSLKGLVMQEESIEQETCDLIMAFEQRLFDDPSLSADQCLELPEEEPEDEIFDPRKFSGVVGLDLSNPGEHELTELFIIFKGLERTGMAFNVVVFMDTFVTFDGRPIYVQRQFDLKCSATPPQDWFWEELISLVQLRESSLESFASWAPVHVLAMSDMMHDLARDGHDAEFFMRYVGALELPFQHIISREADYQLHASRHVSDTLASLRERHRGQWHTDVCSGVGFDEGHN